MQKLTKAQKQNAIIKHLETYFSGKYALVYKHNTSRGHRIQIIGAEITQQLRDELETSIEQTTGIGTWVGADGTTLAVFYD